jgi:hypothetical protein
MNYEEWCKEFVKLLIERVPGLHRETAMDIAESNEECYTEGLSPDEALDAEMECWTDDDDE